eukprot:91111-Chlamydomonas_euryale.AAC.10
MQAVLVPTERTPDTAVIRGYDPAHGRDIDTIMAGMLTTGFQASNLGAAVDEVNRMVRASWGGVGNSVDGAHGVMRSTAW